MRGQENLKREHGLGKGERGRPLTALGAETTSVFRPTIIVGRKDRVAPRPDQGVGVGVGVNAGEGVALIPIGEKTMS